MFNSKFDADEMLGLICDAQTLHPNQSGAYRKQYVLQEMRTELGNENYHRYLPVLTEIIDLLVAIGNERSLVFTLIQKKKKKFPCCVS
jgi:hypothetical protein